MSPIPLLITRAEVGRRAPTAASFGNWRDVDNIEAYIVESWGQGFMFGALLIMAIITVANMKRGVLLHKMILLEVNILIYLYS